ncbi:MAG: SDR family oxidoreductase [Rhodospirillales bacterium]|jgi:NAD(P)-dependent dehydrogenase (short-subunit alcohol dehydrogenase family)|nr:SDR family oxidoreductase [Rhodospirillales bacterium]
MGRVEGKVALVTGAAGGIGGAIALRLAENGARVILTDVSEGGLAETAARITAATGAHAATHKHDVSSEESWHLVMAAVGHACDKLDIVVNSAGIFNTIGQPFDAIPYDEWREIIAVNLDGAFLGTRSGVQAMKGTGGGSIINIASTASYLGTKAGAAYGASKGGIRALTVQAAISCANHRYDVRVNSISPGYVWTPAIESRLTAEYGSKEEGIRAAASRNPLGRVVDPDDVAWGAVYLASDESKMITAFDLVIDGGMLRS